jgi:predicted TIM-barrel fold metal-dependent hydrolase
MKNIDKVMKWPIWDTHVHLPGERWGGNSVEENFENALEIGSRVGITKITAFLTMRQGQDAAYHREIERALERFKGRIYGWLMIHPVNEPDGGLHHVERWVADGPMVAVKTHRGIITRPEYSKLVDRIVELGVPLHTHNWIKTGGDPIRFGGANNKQDGEFVENTPMEMAELGRRYPGHPFVSVHNGGDWELGTRGVRGVPNVYVEVAGGYPEQGQVEYAVKWVGPERVIFGSDAPGARFFGTQVGKVAGADIPDYAKKMIFYDNIARIMRPICEAKGIPV